MIRRARIERVCLLALVLALGGVFGCTSDDDSSAADEPWHKVFEGLSQALLSVWGASSTDVWTVGADVSDGTGHAMLNAVADRAIAESIPVHERTEALALIHDGGR